MKIQEVRASFTVYMIASDLSRLEGIAETLRLAGYMAANFTELTAAFSEFPSNPPHFLLFDFQEGQFNLKKAIKQVALQLPESHIFLVVPENLRAEAVPLIEIGVYDFIYTPLATDRELVRCLDRATERDYFMYLNEQLNQRVAKENSAAQRQTLAASSEEVGVQTSASIYIGEHTTVMPSAVSAGTKAGVWVNEEGHLEFTRQLFQQKSADDCISTFMRLASMALGACGIVYLKYFPNRRVLIVDQSHRLENYEINGIGLNFNEEEPAFRTSDLRDPASLTQMPALVKEVFSTENFFCLPVEALGEIRGIFIFLRHDPGFDQGLWLSDWLTLLNKAIELIEAERRLHVLAVKDPSTDLLTTKNFVSEAHKELSRARRNMDTVSLARITVDQYGVIASQFGQEEAETVLRVVARLLTGQSRVNDVLGRLSADEIGLVLPHTGQQGALIKVERLRRFIQSADFSKVLKSFPKLTISSGVSEYPGLVRDVEELLQSADEALLQVRNLGNKTCVATPADGFTPDFEPIVRGSS